MYKVLLFDIDDTILDFDKAETNAITATLKKYGIIPNIDIIKDYKKINDDEWKRFEKGLTTIPTLMQDRFVTLFTKYGKASDIALVPEINEFYLNELNKTSDIVDGVDVVLNKLKDKYEIYPASNGVGQTQVDRLESSLVKGIFKRYYVSGFIGYQKPQKEFFDYIFKDLSITNPKEVLMIGDSLTSDILGGINAGVDTCWFNYRNKVNDKGINPTYEIKRIEEIFEILKEE